MPYWSRLWARDSNSEAAVAGSGIHLALEHLAAARFLGSGAMRFIAGGFRSVSPQVDRTRQSNSSQTTLQERCRFLKRRRYGVGQLSAWCF
jgi:hypothetical protein